MKKTLFLFISASFVCAFTTPVMADEQIELLKQQIEQLKQDYEKRIQALEKGLLAAQQAAKKNEQTLANVQEQAEEAEMASDDSQQMMAKNSFNPEISLILDGRYASYQNNPDNYQLPGFLPGDEAGLVPEGFSIGESELTISANIDQLFYGKATIAFAEDDEGTSAEVEEAYAQTSALFDGLSIKMGRFFSSLGYLNEQHAHTWDFADAPLVYRALFGDQYRDDGVQISYIAPTDLFVQVGTELFSGSSFPASGSHNGVGSWTVFARIGGDINSENSWQIGLSHWKASNIEDRESENLNDSTTIFNGDSEINAINLVYKWTPNTRTDNLKLQFEYFDRDEDGDIALDDFLSGDTSSYHGDQKGWYAQAIYQMNKQWRTGLRYDHLSSHTKGSNYLVLENAGLESHGYKPERYSAMLEWLPSEFSSIRLQYNNDQSYKDSDNQLFLQYTFSMGSHGAHSY